MKERIQAAAPYGALLSMHILMYAAAASFSLRPRTGERLVPVFLPYFITALVISHYYPVILRCFKQLTSTGRLKTSNWLGLLLPIGLFSYLASLFLGYDAWLYNKPLRLVSNMILAAYVPMAYQVFVQNVAKEKRGFWFGLSFFAGLTTHRLLLLFGNGSRNHPDTLDHDALTIVFFTQLVVTIVFVASYIVAYRMPPGGKNRLADTAPPLAGARTETAASSLRVLPLLPAKRLFLAAALVYIMTGLIDVRLFPTVFIRPSAASDMLQAAIGLVCPLVGWYMDKNPGLHFPRLMHGCGWVFMLAPSLAAMGDMPVFFRIVHALTTSGQFTVFICFSTILANQADSDEDSYRLPSMLFSWRGVGIACLAAVRFIFDLPLGATLPMATLSALGFYVVVRRLRPGDAHPAGAGYPVTPVLPAGAAVVEFTMSDPVMEMPTSLSDTLQPGQNSLDSFLDSGELSAREREVVMLILRDGLGTREIAAELGLSEHTVKTYSRKALHKFGVSTRKALIALYVSRESGAEC